MIKTDRLILKKINKNDEVNMLELLTNNEIKKTYMIPNYDCIDKYIKLFNRFLDLSSKTNHFVRGIYLNEILIGFINDVEINSKCIELGYVINPKHKNKGYATEALLGSINYLFNNGFEEIVTGAFEENYPSIRVMNKCGMHKIDKIDKIDYNGNVYNCVYFSLRRNDYE